MTGPIAIVLAVLVTAVVLFAVERIPLEVTALGIVLALAATGVLTPDQAFAGFANDIVIFEFTLLAMTQGLASTGVIQMVGRWLARLARFGPRALLGGIMLVVMAVSSVVSNTVTTAAFLPVAIGAADRARIPRGKLLMPVAFAAMLGGTIFLVGTSTNLVVSSLIQRFNQPGIGFAELAPVSIPVAIAGALVVLLAAPVLLPDRSTEDEDALPARTYLAELVVPAGSAFVGRPLSEATHELGVAVLAVTREGTTLEPRPEVELAAGDGLAAEGERLDLLRIQDVRGIEMKGDTLDREQDEDAILVEATVPVGSSLVGRSLRDAFFAEHFGLVALAVSRRPAIQRLTRMQLLGGLFGTQSLSSLPLAVGDVLLLRGPRERVRALSDAKTLGVLGNVEFRRARTRKALFAVVIFLAVLVGAATRSLPYAVLGLAGMIAMIATRCMDARTAFRVDWRVALLIACMLSLGTAMDTTGAGRYLGSLLEPLAHVIGPRGTLIALMLVTIALSAPMSNQAAAAVLLPVAIGVADQLGIGARPLAMGICLAASCSFLTPLEPSCVLVYGPGRYRFADFLRLGAPLTVVVVGLYAALVPLRWPF